MAICGKSRGIPPGGLKIERLADNQMISVTEKLNLNPNVNDYLPDNHWRNYRRYREVRH